MGKSFRDEWWPPKISTYGKIVAITFLLLYLPAFIPVCPMYCTEYVPGPFGLPIFFWFWYAWAAIMIIWVVTVLWIGLKKGYF